VQAGGTKVLGTIAKGADELNAAGHAAEGLGQHLDDIGRTLDDFEYPTTLDNLHLNTEIPDLQGLPDANIAHGVLPDDLGAVGNLLDDTNKLPGSPSEYAKLPDFNAADLPSQGTNKLPASPSEYAKLPDFNSGNLAPGDPNYGRIPKGLQENPYGRLPKTAPESPDGKLSRVLPEQPYDTVPELVNQRPAGAEYGSVQGSKNRLPGTPNEYGKLPEPGYAQLPAPLNYVDPGPANTRAAQMFPPGGLDVGPPRIRPGDLPMRTRTKVLIGAVVFVAAGGGIAAPVAVIQIQKKK
jgi:hypothetical protein